MQQRFRFLATAVGAMLLFVGAAFAAGVGCSAEAAGESGLSTTAPRKDASAVDPAEAGASVGEANGSASDCARYCALVTTNCTGDDAQYASEADCLAFCPYLPLRAEPAAATSSTRASASLACRQYWADTPARTDPRSSCLAAGPFGGNVCGDRCTALCDVLLAACPPGTAHAVYADQPACATACAGFTYVDAGVDGGGETPTGPDAGDTLNCRLYHLRAATVDGARCADLRDDGACTAAAPER